MSQIEIRCKTCGRLHTIVVIEGKLKYDFKCSKCKKENIGIITNKFGNKK